MTDASDILQTAFEEVNPGPWNDYMYHPTIRKVSWGNLSGSARYKQTNSGRFLRLKRTRVTTFPNNYVVWAQSDAMLGFLSSCGNLQNRGKCWSHLSLIFSRYSKTYGPALAAASLKSSRDTSKAHPPGCSSYYLNPCNFDHLIHLDKIIFTPSGELSWPMNCQSKTKTTHEFFKA